MGGINNGVPSSRLIIAGTNMSGGGPLSADVNLAASGGGGGIDSGAAFPVGPADHDLFFNTTNGYLFEYVASVGKWLSAFEVQLTLNYTGVTASNTGVALIINGGFGDFGLYLVDAIIYKQVSGTGNWTLNIQKLASGGTLSTLASVSNFTNTTPDCTEVALGVSLSATDLGIQLGAVENSGTATLLSAGTINARILGN